MTGITGSPRDLRALLVCPYGDVGGGAENWILAILDQAQGLDVRVVLLAPGPLVDQFQQRDIPVTVIPTGPRPVDITRSVVPLTRLVRRLRPDVVVGNGVKAQVVGAPAARLAGVASVWIKHDHSWDRTLARPLALASTTVVATAREVGEATRRRDLVVIEPARPSEPYDAEDSRGALAAAGLSVSQLPTLAMLTRLVPYKGVDVAIRALALDGGRSWRLAVVGGADSSAPDEVDRLEHLATELGVRSRVEFLGRIDHAGRLLRGVDALAVLTRPAGPRTPSGEGYGITASEAMMAEIPVVYGGTGAIARRLGTPHGPAGLVVPQGDPIAMAAALAVLRDPGVRVRLGAAGRLAALALPDIVNAADRLVTVLQRAATGARGGSA